MQTANNERSHKKKNKNKKKNKRKKKKKKKKKRKEKKGNSFFFFFLFPFFFIFFFFSFLNDFQLFVWLSIILRSIFCIEFFHCLNVSIQNLHYLFISGILDFFDSYGFANNWNNGNSLRKNVGNKWKRHAKDCLKLCLGPFHCRDIDG